MATLQNTSICKFMNLQLEKIIKYCQFLSVFNIKKNII